MIKMGAKKTTILLYILMIVLVAAVAYAVDIPPVFLDFSASDNTVNTNALLIATTTDVMDNAGIDWIKIYENNTWVNTGDYECGGAATCVKSHFVYHPNNSTFSYYAVTRDIGGNEVTSDTEIIVFRGNANPYFTNNISDITVNETEFIDINATGEVNATDPRR